MREAPILRNSSVPHKPSPDNVSGAGNPIPTCVLLLSYTVPAREDMKPCFLAIASLMLASSVAARGPAQTAATDKPKQDLCNVSGLVVKSGDGTPLRKAIVRLSSIESDGKSSSARTEEDGRFVLDKIGPGRYRLTVTRHGYVTQEYGQRRPSDPSAILALSPGQRMSDLIFKLIPAAVLRGHVQDEDGEPMPWVHITAFRLAYFNGKRSASSEYEASTNDLGEYRLFDVAPGRYFIAANYEPGADFVNGRRTMMGDTSLNPGYVVTYYPNTSDPGKAAAVSVKGGDEISSIDLILSPSHVVKVRGRAMNAITGKPGTGISVSLWPRESQLEWEFQQLQTFGEAKDGSFEISNVPPGSYFAVAFWHSEGKSYRAQQPVDVGAADVDGIALTISAGQDISGRLIWDGKPETGRNELRVYLRPLDSQQFPNQPSPVKPDGSFVLSNVAEGRWHVQMFGIGRDTFIKSVRYGTTDISAQELNVSRGIDGSLEVTLSSRAARIGGTVTNSDSLPAPGAWVVLVPEAAHRDDNWLYDSTNTDQNGRFELHGIVPGEYKLFSWDEVEEGAWEDPDFLKPFEEKGEKVSIQEGDAKSIDLVTIKTASAEQQ